MGKIVADHLAGKANTPPLQVFCRKYWRDVITDRYQLSPNSAHVVCEVAIKYRGKDSDWVLIDKWESISDPKKVRIKLVCPACRESGTENKLGRTKLNEGDACPNPECAGKCGLMKAE